MMYPFTHRFLLSLALVAACLSQRSAGEEKPARADAGSHSYTALIESVDVISDTGETSIRIKVDTGNILLDTIRILFSKDSGNAIESWWFTKGGYQIELPDRGLPLKSIPKQGSKVRIEFSGPVPPESSSIGELRILAIKPLDGGASARPGK